MLLLDSIVQSCDAKYSSFGNSCGCSDELLYRFRRLSDKGWNKLHQERKRKDSDNVTLEEYSELCNMYLGINESEDCIATRE